MEDRGPWVLATAREGYTYPVEYIGGSPPGARGSPGLKWSWASQASSSVYRFTFSTKFGDVITLKITIKPKIMGRETLALLPKGRPG